jgi:hypothetical protein
LFTGLSITKWLIGGQFTSAKTDILHCLLNCKLKGFKISSFMAAVAEWLFKTLSAAAPSVYLIVGFRVFYDYWPAMWGDRLKSLCTLSCIVLLDISDIFNVQVVLGELLEGLFGVCWLYDPGFRFHVLQFSQEEPC